MLTSLRRFHLKFLRSFSTKPIITDPNPEESNNINTQGYNLAPDDIKGIKHREGQKDGMLMMLYTCAVEGCGTKQGRTFSKSSYERGVVLLRCEGCNNLHLIADNLGWFEDDGTYKGKNTNIETILAAKGEKVQKFISDETMEFLKEDEAI